jgi:hypothetical protein
MGSEDRLEACRAAIGPKRALIGNLNNLRLLRWEPERVQFEARRAIATAG